MSAELRDDFKGDTQHLIECIEAWLSLDAAGASVPIGPRVGGHARILLAAAAVRLATPPAQPSGSEGSVVDALLGFLRVEATVSGGRIYYPERRLRELLAAAPRLTGTQHTTKKG